jgi:hypothetical protein
MMKTPNLYRPLRESAIPKLVVAGEHDLWRAKLYRRFAGRIGASVAVYATGHSPCETTPHQLALDMVQLFRTSEKLSAR